MTRVVFIGLLAVVALAPLPFASNRPWSWGLLSLAVGVLTVLWAVAAVRDREAIGAPWRRIWPFVVIFAAIVGWIVAQAGTWTPEAWHHPLWRQAAKALGEPLAGSVSIDREQTLVALMRLLAYAGVFWLAMQLGRSPDRARTMIWIVALAGFVYSVYGLVIEFTGSNTILWYQRWAYADSLTSTFVNRNAFATYAGLSLVTVLGLLLDEIRRGSGGEFDAPPGLRWLLEGLPGRLGALGLMALVTGSTLLLTHSRGGLLSSLIGIAVLVAGFVAVGGNRPVIAVSIAAGAALFVVAVVGLSGDVVLSRFDRAYDDAVERSEVYSLVWKAILDEPWLGTGYGTFESAFPLIRDASIDTEFIYDKAHNSYLEFAYETGVPAFALMMGLLGALTALCVRGLWRRSHHRVFPSIGVAAAALVATHALFDFGIQMPAVAVTFCLLLGTACAQSWPMHQPPRRRSTAKA